MGVLRQELRTDSSKDGSQGDNEMFHFISCLAHGDQQVNRTVTKTTIFVFISFICFYLSLKGSLLGPTIPQLLIRKSKELRAEHLFLKFIKNSFHRDWRDDSAIKRISKGPRFNSKHLHGCWTLQSQRIQHLLLVSIHIEHRLQAGKTTIHIKIFN